MSENSSHPDGQKDVDNALDLDERDPLSSSVQIMEQDKHDQGTQKTVECDTSSTVYETVDSTEGPLPSLAVKYLLSYRDSDGSRLRDEVVPNLQSLEPMHRNQCVQGRAILEVTRIITIEEMHIDHTKSLTEQHVSINQYGACEIKINSAAIINALYSVISYWPGLNLNTPSLTIPEPFAILYQHRETLRDYADSVSCSQAKNDDERCEREKNADTHLKLLFDLLDGRPEAKKIEIERERHNRPRPVATFEMLWMLFPPGTDVFHDLPGDGFYTGFVVKEVSGAGLAMQSAKPLEVVLWYLDYNGQYIGRTEECVTIQPFTGERDISTLSVIPCNLYKQVTSGTISDESRLLRQTLVGYGEKFLELTKRKCVQYSGQTCSFPRRSYHSRVVVDAEGFFHTNPDLKPKLLGLENDEITPIRPCSCTFCNSNRQIKSPWEHGTEFGGYDRLRPKANDFVGLTDHQKFVCDRRVFGYVLNVRSWQLLDIANITECQWNKSMIDNQLSIHDGDRHMIKGLVDRYFRGQPLESAGRGQWQADFISDKGDSLIFLLHGKPGVGKTFTAECTADFVQRPLLSLSCNDIGVDPDQVEMKLLSYFKMAKLWGAVLLLDEADVYLEQRTSRDLDRNCLVAAFLRCLEYYQGVLFLTTNRVGAFDDALVSRINIVLHYEFDEERRQDVWDTFFRKLEHDRGSLIKVPYSTREYCRHDPELRQLEWNGREIRNAFKTAVALAEYKEDRQPDDDGGSIMLQQVYFQQVVRMSSNFARYLRKLHGAGIEKVAAGRGDRNEYSKLNGAKKDPS